MRNLRLLIAYQGTAYSGWQIQPRVPTIQGVIEERLALMTRTPCRLRVAGRTDAGVHARGQVANFRTESSINPHGFLRGLNALLPPDITILAVEEVPLDFDARRHNRGKHYRYQIWNERIIPPERAATCYHLHRTLDIETMARAARQLVGTHDFAAFRSASCECLTTTRTLYRCTVGREGALIHFDVEGTAFLKNMVRIIAGTLVEAGRRRRAPEDLPLVLRSGDRSRAGATLPPEGLSLERVFL